MLNPNLKSINRRKRVKVDLKILRGRILKFFHNRKSEVILGVFCKNQFDSQSLGGGIFDRLQLFSRTKFRVLSDFQVQNEKIAIFRNFSQLRFRNFSQSQFDFESEIAILHLLQLDFWAILQPCLADTSINWENFCIWPSPRSRPFSSLKICLIESSRSIDHPITNRIS